VDRESQASGCLFSFVQIVELQLRLNQNIFQSWIQCNL